MQKMIWEDRKVFWFQEREPYNAHNATQTSRVGRDAKSGYDMDEETKDSIWGKEERSKQKRQGRWVVVVIEHNGEKKSWLKGDRKKGLE